MWLIFAGVSVILLLLHWLGVLDAQQFGWRVFATLFGVGGLALFVIAGVVAFWEND